MSDYIPLTECQPGHVYKIMSRNLGHGVYDGAGGFIGIREKFGSQYLFTEYHWDQGPPFGTVHPETDLGPLPEDLTVAETLRMYDEVTGRTIAWDFDIDRGDDVLPRSGWYRYCDGDKEPMPQWPEGKQARLPNTALFDYLMQYEGV